MSEQTQAAAPAAKKVRPVSTAESRAARKKLKRAGKKKLMTKLNADKEFAKAYFEGRSKRATDKKSNFRKKKARKKVA